MRKERKPKKAELPEVYKPDYFQEAVIRNRKEKTIKRKGDYDY